MNLKSLIKSGNVLEIGNERYLVVSYRDDGCDSMMIVGRNKSFFTSDFNEELSCGYGDNKILIDGIYSLSEQINFNSKIFQDSSYQFRQQDIIWQRNRKEVIKEMINLYKERVLETEEKLSDYKYSLEQFKRELEHV